MKDKKRIYINVVTSGLIMLANKVSTIVQPYEDEFDVCSTLAVQIATENKLEWSNVLVQYFNHYSDEVPVIHFRIPRK